jgi:alpha-L-rhamnosidase
MKVFFYTLGAFVLVFLLPGCTGKRESPEQAAFFTDTPAEWICDGRPLPETDSMFYLDWPAPRFRKEFTSGNNIENARLFITAAGYYQAFLNGEIVGKNVLDPAWTDFSKRIYYTVYDVTSQIREGNNCFGVSLGNGFYNPLPMRKWGRRNLRKDLEVGKPVFIAKLLISYKDGSVEEVVSDGSWKYAFGPIIKNSVYLGVVHDAREELAGWNTTGYDETSWIPADRGKDPGGMLQEAFFPPVQVTREIRPQTITSPEPGIFLVDMGENFTGTYRIRLSGNTGDTVTFRFGERIYPDGTLNPMTAVIGQIKKKGIGGPGAPDIAWQTDSYIFGDESEAWFSPPFTYHVYRYMEISGLKTRPEIGDIRGLFLHSNVRGRNSFTSSSQLLNSIQEATERTFRSNLVSVQSDCAAREKFGYGGDLNATAESFICNFDMQAFYRKTIYDWVDAMKDSSFVDTAPFAGIEYCGLSWESAYLITQYYLYLYYNDTDILEEHWELNKKWMDKVAQIHPDGFVHKGLSDHESLEPVPVQLTGTCHYLHCARIMSLFASIMGDSSAKEKYETLSDRLKAYLRTEFWDRPRPEKINRQTLFSALLYHGIVPDTEIHAARDSLLQAIKNGPSGHFNTGIFGTKYILEALSEYESPERVYDIVNSREYPGWGHMIDSGASTIWETWRESDNTFSNNHPMFGTVTEWFYRWLGGIRPEPDFPGFEEFILNPATPAGLDSVNCSYHSPYGQIISNWKRVDQSNIFYTMKIPEGSTARVSLSLSAHQMVEIQKDGEKVRTGEIIGMQSGKFSLGAGDYRILVSTRL